MRRMRVDWQVPAAESASVGDFEPKLVDSQALDFAIKGRRWKCE